MSREGMHAYATRSKERKAVFFGLALASVAIFLGLTELPGLSTLFAFHGWVSPPSVLGLYGGLVWVFDRLLWRIPPISWLLSTPNLAGQWSGTLQTGYDDGGSEHLVNVRVSQRWMKISIELETDRSRSWSEMAAFSRLSSPTPELTYQYTNKPGPLSPSSMHSHQGTAQLSLRTGPDGEISLKGRYYSGRDRGNVGSIELVRDDG